MLDMLHMQKKKKEERKGLASFNNHEKGCNMLCGKSQVQTQDLGIPSGALLPLHYTPSYICTV
jgi:hypothetical protein